MNFPNQKHFENFQSQINIKLNELVNAGKLDPDLVKKQIEKYHWLYGALGQVPSDVMFVCENPSFAGIKKAHKDTIDGSPPDIEAQWWGGSTDFAATRFRVALYELGLKISPPRERGGWQCYITNVIKQANRAKDQEEISSSDKKQQAREWSENLQWEIDQVKPKFVFCVGGNAHKEVGLLQRERLLERFPTHKVIHYSARGSTQMVISRMVDEVAVYNSK